MRVTVYTWICDIPLVIIIKSKNNLFIRLKLLNLQYYNRFGDNII
jgi:hypothetical protein